MQYTITEQISITPLKSGQLEIYGATVHGAGKSKIAIINQSRNNGEFSHSVNTKIKFSPRCCVNEILFEPNITR